MPLITQEIKNLKGGISQQPDLLRFPDQGQEQVNGFSSEVRGLQKRPPTVHIARLGDSLGTKPLVSLINRDETERYYVVYKPNGGGVDVYSLDGTKMVVNAPNGFSYLNTPDPRKDIRAISVADYTFIVNRQKVVSMGTAVAHPGYGTRHRVLIHVKGGQYAKTYKVTINGTYTATHTTPVGDQPTHANEVDTQFITGQLHAKMVTALAGVTGVSVAKGSNWIMVEYTDRTKAWTSVVTEDGMGNTQLIAFIDEAQRFNQLPAIGPDGYIIKVIGDPGSGSDDYYVRFEASSGLWKETIEPGTVTGYNQATMPHVLVREANGTFTFRQASWDARAVGDEDSNPVPSFVDATISDVFFFRNRLGLLSGENIILSRSGEFFSFYPKSVVAAPDTDPIDVAVSHNRVNRLNHAVPFAEELLLWSDQTQFVLRSDGVLSPRSVRVDQATEFASSISARPVAAGRNVYFATPRATFSSIRRYYAVQDVSAVKNAEDIASHVPNYIPNGVFFMGSSTTENLVTCLTEGAENRIYIYKYLYIDEVIVQQSWSHWELSPGARILACEFVGATMYILRDSAQGLFLERLEFTYDTKDFDGEPYRVFADRKVRHVVDNYDITSNTSTVPFAALYGVSPVGTSAVFWAVRDDGKAFQVEAPEGVWGPTDTSFKLPGNNQGKGFTIGVTYEFRYVFSKFLIKTEDSTGTKSETTGRLQIRRAWVNYEDSGSFSVVVCGQYEYRMTGRKLGAVVLGQAALDTNKFQFPVMTNANNCHVQISSTDPTPLAIIGAGWSGVYWRKEEVL